MMFKWFVILAMVTAALVLGQDAKQTPSATGRGHLEAHGISMEFTVSVLSQQVGRTILDKTGLTGKYDYTLEWEPDDAPPMAGNEKGLPVDSGKASIFTALQEQLGLKLEPQKAPISVLFIDHIEAPSVN
jgi:uncharacterized protein (TIGR03435 family)